MNHAAAQDADPPGLLQKLTWYQIFMICIGGTVGIGFAKSSGEIIAIAGPGGTLIAFVVVGVVAICVMEGICEMINLWPISNAMIEFVREFVDPDLAVVVGFTYWYAYCCAFSALIVAAGSLLQYFNISNVLLNIVYVVSMLGIFLVNCCGVMVFGEIEFWGGILKIFILLGLFVLMCCINAGVNTDHSIGSIPFIDGVRNNPNVAASHGIAVLIAIPLAVFAYIGVELVTVTAFEAKNPRDLRLPAKHIAYVILIIYVITIGGISANVEWFDQNLPSFFSQALVDPNSSVADLGHVPIADQSVTYSTSFAPVIACLEAGKAYVPVASVLLGFLVYSALSCANANLYVASRTLYGLTRDLDFDSRNWFERFFAHLNMVTPRWRVPLWSVIASIALVGSWLPFVKLGLGAQDLFTVMSSIGSVGVLLVWASQCLAFIRYNKWLWIHKDELTGTHYERFQRWPIKSKFSSYAATLQPFPAYLGLVSCLVIVFFFYSAGMWNGNKVLLKGLHIYLAPAFSFLLFLTLKIINRRGWVKLSDDWTVLHRTLDRLDSLIIHTDMVHQQTAPMAAASPPLLTANGNNTAHFSEYSDLYPPQSTPGSGRFSPNQDIQYPPQQHPTGSGRFSPTQDAQAPHQYPPQQHMSGAGQFPVHHDIQYPPLQQMTSVERVPVMLDVQYQPQPQPPPPGSGGGGFAPQPDMLRPMDRQDPMRRSVPYSEISEADAGPSQSHGYHGLTHSPISPGGDGGAGYSMSPTGGVGGGGGYPISPGEGGGAGYSMSPGGGGGAGYSSPSGGGGRWSG